MSEQALLHESNSTKELCEADEADSYDTHFKSKSSPVNRLQIATQLYIALLATIICALLVLNTFHRGDYAAAAERNLAEASIELSYSRDHRYMSLDHKYDSLWQYGNQSRLRLPDHELGTGTVTAAISMFHQLHCLSHIRSALQDAADGISIGHDWHDNSHWPHCLDYLRNTFLCHADDTLELPPIVDGVRAHFIDGGDDIRKCKSAKALFDLQGDDLNTRPE